MFIILLGTYEMTIVQIPHMKDNPSYDKMINSRQQPLQVTKGHYWISVFINVDFKQIYIKWKPQKDYDQLQTSPPHITKDTTRIHPISILAPI